MLALDRAWPTSSNSRFQLTGVFRDTHVTNKVFMWTIGVSPLMMTYSKSNPDVRNDFNHYVSGEMFTEKCVCNINECTASRAS